MVKINDPNTLGANQAPEPIKEQLTRVAIKHIGHDDVKHMLYDSIVFYLDHKQDYEDVGIQANKGILLHGTSGTGKSSLAQEVAHEVQTHYGIDKIEVIEVKFSDLASAQVSGSSQKVEEYFSRLKAIPKFKILLMDEMESLAPKRHNAGVLATERTDALLKAIDYLPDMFIFGMTNHKEKIDQSFLRDGRLGDCVEITIPNDDDKMKFISLWLDNGRIKYEAKVSLKVFAQHFNMVGADFKYLENKLFTMYLKSGKHPITPEQITIIDMHLTNKLNARGV